MNDQARQRSTRPNVRLERRGATSRGFTLIELLVVIAIISLLVSILLPSLSRAKDLARSAVCSSSLRSIGMTGLLYSNENKEYYVPFGRRFASNWGVCNLTTYPRWFNYMEAYNEDYHLYNCPVMNVSKTYGSSQGRDTMVVNSAGEDGLPSWVTRGRSAYGATSNYAYNRATLGSWEDNTGGWAPDYAYTARTIDQVTNLASQAGQNLANVVWISDGVYEVTNAVDVENWYSASSLWRYVHPNERMNVLMAEGHVESVVRYAITHKGLTGQYQYITVLYKE